MKKKRETGGVNPQHKNLQYELKPISVKLTSKTRDMLDYLQETMQISKSDVIRLCITKYYYSELENKMGD